MRISIVCPVHDTPPSLIAAAARSVLHDPSGGIRQLILVDDGSRREDTSRTLVQIAATDPRVMLLQAPDCLGPASARNLGLAVAREDWIGFLNPEDAWLPGHPARLGRVAAAHPGAAWISARHLLVSPAGDSERARGLASPAARRLADDLLGLEGPDLTRLLLSEGWLHLGASVVRRELAREVSFGEGLHHFEDHLFLARLSTRAPLHYVEADGYAARCTEPGLRVKARRLPSAALAMYRLAARDRMLRGFRREIGSARRAAANGVALGSLMAGRRWQALAMALHAWSQDPREFAELLLFLRLWRRGAGVAQRFMTRRA